MKKLIIYLFSPLSTGNGTYLSLLCYEPCRFCLSICRTVHLLPLKFSSSCTSASFTSTSHNNCFCVILVDSNLVNMSQVLVMDAKLGLVNRVSYSFEHLNYYLSLIMFVHSCTSTSNK